jgi:hypothetical protein
MVAGRMAERPRPTRCSKCYTDTEHNGSCKCYKGQNRSGSRDRSRGDPRNQGSHGRVDPVHESEPPAHEGMGKHKADKAGTEGHKKL